jgi:hypothetical protein
MHSTNKPFWRSHPILFAALIGAIIGCAVTLVVELSGIFGHNSSAVIQMLSPGSALGITEAGAVRTVLIMFIEIAGNALGYALLFALPTALIVAIRRAFRSRSS